MDMVVLSDPEVVGIPVVECGEPLVDLRTVGALRLDTRLADPQGSFARLRVGVVDRLVTAQTLLPVGLRLLIIEGYRPAALQRRYFDAHVDRLRAGHPEASAADLHRRASTYISPPEVAPHVAGAAVDVTLCTVDGVELAMGTEVNDTDTTACHTASPDIDAQARENRRLLSEALSAAGLVNYPSEWWHWSYGDRYWAFATGAENACYGEACDPNTSDPNTRDAIDPDANTGDRNTGDRNTGDRNTGDRNTGDLNTHDGPVAAG